MSDWDTSSDEDAGGPGWPPSSAAAAPPCRPPSSAAAPLCRPPPSAAVPLCRPPLPSQGGASVEGGGGRKSAEWRWEAAAAAAGLGEEERGPRGSGGSCGPREAARQRPPRVGAGQAGDAVAPLCFHLDNALVGALIGNNGRTHTPRGGLGPLR